MKMNVITEEMIERFAKVAFYASVEMNNDQNDKEYIDYYRGEYRAYSGMARNFGIYGEFIEKLAELKKAM